MVRLEAFLPGGPPCSRGRLSSRRIRLRVRAALCKPRIENIPVQKIILLFLNGQTRALFVYFRSFHSARTNIAQNLL